MRKSMDSSVIMTAQGTTITKEKATVCVTDLDMCIDVQLLVDSPAALSPGNLCEEHGHSWRPGEFTHHQQWEDNRW